MPAPRLACIMPFLNEAKHLPKVLASLEDQSLARERIFLIAVDNGSSDGGEALVAAWLARTGTAGTLVRADLRSIPHALNVGLSHVSEDDIVVRLDAHTIYDPTYLATIAEAFEELGPRAWCVGGAPTPAPAEDFSSALGEALYSNPMGLGPADFRHDADRVRQVSTVYLGAWRPGVLQALGGFDERWAANEDCELTERIAEVGGEVYRIPVHCGRICTRGPLATVRQWSRYGFWRAQTFKRYPTAIRARHVVAPGVLLAALGLLFSPLRLALLPLYVLYALAAIALRRSGERPLVTACSLVFFPFVHSAYAAGLMLGALRSPASLRD
jgi:succinoglycan biosynthesis protein ExoA